MTDFLQLFISGCATGAIYALAALGFTLLWQASGTINFAQGEFVMLPAFMMLAFGAAGFPLPLAFFARWGGLLIAGVFGWIVLQTRGVAHLGPAIWGTLVSAALLAATARRPR